MPGGSASRDWRDPADYAPLIRADRCGFAWEWLRRQPAYAEAALDALSRRDGFDPVEERRALGWHLHRFEDPRLGVPAARPVWAATRHRWVVGARSAEGDLGGDLFDVREYREFASIVRSPAGERLLLSDGLRTIRLDVEGRSLTRSPVRLSYDIAGLRSLDRPLLVLQRLRSLALRRRFADTLHPPVRPARRMILVLRTFDALAAGACQADIAEVLLPARFERLGWRHHSPSVRSQAQRLVHGARRMAAGDFWSLLD